MDEFVKGLWVKVTTIKSKEDSTLHAGVKDKYVRAQTHPQRWMRVDNLNGTISFRAITAQGPLTDVYMSAPLGHNQDVRVEGHNKDCERWTLKGDRLKSHHGTYLSFLPGFSNVRVIDTGPHLDISTVALKVSPWSIQVKGRLVALRTKFQTYVSMRSDGVLVHGPVVERWVMHAEVKGTKFQAVRDGMLSGRYMTATRGESGKVGKISTWSHAGDWETWSVNGLYIKSFHGHFLSANPKTKLVQLQPHSLEWEKIKIMPIEADPHAGW